MVKTDKTTDKKKKEAPCIFCNIVQGKEKSWVLYEDPDFLVILDAFPVTEGHTLVLPKKHHKNILELSEDEVSKVFNLARRVAKVMMEKLEAESVNIATAPSVVPHFHLHIIPRYIYDMMGPLADLDNKRELPPEVMERIRDSIKEGLDALKEV